MKFTKNQTFIKEDGAIFHIFQNSDETWEVWMNPGITPWTGFSIGKGQTRDAAVMSGVTHLINARTVLGKQLS